MDTLSIVSINAKGLKTIETQRILLQDLKRLKIDTAFIQETHFKKK